MSVFSITNGGKLDGVCLMLAVVASCFLFVGNPVAAQDNPSDYDIPLIGGTLLPGDGSALETDLRAAVESRSKTGVQSSDVFVLVQYSQFPTTIDLESLQKVDAKDISKVSNTARLVRAAPESVVQLRQLDNINWVGFIPAKFKLSPDLDLINTYDWTIRSGGQRAYHVVFHPGVSADEVEGLAKSVGASLEDFRKGAFPVIRFAVFVMNPDAVAVVAGHNGVSWIEPATGPDEDNNLPSQQLANVDDIQGAPYNLSGTGITVGVWEATGAPLTTHVDLTPRVTIFAGEPTASGGHATHVTGTIASSGSSNANVEGMAPAVNIIAWDSDSDTAEMTTASATATPLRISNHSYGKGIDRGWDDSGSVFNNTQIGFGRYDANTQAFDNVVIANDLIAIVAAGNDRQQDWDGTTMVDIDGDGVNDPTPPNDCQQSGFAVDADCISPIGSAKNVITVGARNTVSMFSGSAFGPTDDGRVKPDILADGANVTSLENTSNTATGTRGGTSMATPALSGIAALVLEDLTSRGESISAAGMKALLIQTAQDITLICDTFSPPCSSTSPSVLHAAAGPDYATGYGTVDAKAAIDLLRRPGGRGLIEDSLASDAAADVKSWQFYVPPGTPDLRVTLAWTDPTSGVALLSSASQLVNNLELVLIEPDDGTPLSSRTRTPWALDPANPQTPAMPDGGADSINNVEQVYVPTPVDGLWTAQVSATGALTNVPQAFALAGPLTSERSDVVLVMDRSGSMDWPAGAASGFGSGGTKLDALKNAVGQFIDYLEIAGGLTLGLEQFEETTVDFVPLFDLQALDSGNVMQAKNAVNDMMAGGWTNIIDGVTDGAAQLTGANALHEKQAIVLFSDGRHNRPMGTTADAIDGIMDPATLFYSIGFGDDVEDAILQPIADSRGGIHLNDTTEDPLILGKMFMTVAGLLVDEEIAVDPDYNLALGKTAELAVNAVPGDAAITFATNWESKNNEALSFRLLGPVKCDIPMKDHPHFKTRVGDTYRLVRVNLPYQCHNGKRLHSGSWTLQATAVQPDVNDRMEAVKIMAFADTHIALDSRISGKASPVLQARFSGLDEAGQFTQMRAFVSFSPPGDGSSIKKDQTSADNRSRDSDFLARMVKPTEIKLRDDGKKGDQSAGDGIHSALLPIDKDGLYQIRVVGRTKTGYGEVTREIFTTRVIGKR